MRISASGLRAILFPMVSVVVLACGSGCGSSTVVTNDTTSFQNQKVSGKEAIRSRLQSIADSGSGGSAISGLKEALTELKASEPALADDLLKQLPELERLQDPPAIKALATKMVDKLK